VVITSSGGPFRGKKRDELAEVTKTEALAHPTWSMGEKISVDSATLMNKGLEVIEAHHLFEVDYDRIEVVVHPQSLVHGLVGLIDGSLLAHVGPADMRVPIAYALYYPKRTPLDVGSLRLSGGFTLDFSAPDEGTFPAIKMAREAGILGDTATCALNAANEVAVNAFMEGALPFLGIYEVVEAVLAESAGGDLGTYAEARAVDEWARDRAATACARNSRRR
jgi:1-deoxy-D-xylulose-5-phosphate reductoisomerase